MGNENKLKIKRVNEECEVRLAVLDPKNTLKSNAVRYVSIWTVLHLTF